MVDTVLNPYSFAYSFPANRIKVWVKLEFTFLTNKTNNPLNIWKKWTGKLWGFGCVTILPIQTMHHNGSRLMTRVLDVSFFWKCQEKNRSVKCPNICCNKATPLQASLASLEPFALVTNHWALLFRGSGWFSLSLQCPNKPGQPRSIIDLETTRCQIFLVKSLRERIAGRYMVEDGVIDDMCRRVPPPTPNATPPRK